MSEMNFPFVQRIASHVALSVEERESLSVFSANRRHYPPKTDVVKQGERFDRVAVLHSGWAIRAKVLPDGRRAILNFMLPGDICCLYCPLTEVPNYAVTTVTDAQFSAIGFDQIMQAVRQHPRMVAAIGWLAAQEEAVTLERASCLSQRTAFERMAHLLLELHHRLLPIGLVQEQSFHMPLTHELMADSLGISHVHVSRTLRKLRGERLVDLEGTTVRLLDMEGLERVAAFDDLYLYRAGMSPTAMSRVAQAG